MSFTGCLLHSFLEIGAFSNLDFLRANKEKKCPQMRDGLKAWLLGRQEEQFLGASQTSSLQICHTLEWLGHFLILELLESGSKCSTSGSVNPHLLPNGSQICSMWPSCLEKQFSQYSNNQPLISCYSLLSFDITLGCWGQTRMRHNDRSMLMSILTKINSVIIS